jgi:hypothetical protein
MVFDKQFIKDIYPNAVMNAFGAVSLETTGQTCRLPFSWSMI